MQGVSSVALQVHPCPQTTVCAGHHVLPQGLQSKPAALTSNGTCLQAWGHAARCMLLSVQACCGDMRWCLPAGLVDALGILVTLPQGTEQIFLSMAFGLEGFLMLLHKKHEPVDLIAHELLGYTMVAGNDTL